MQAEEERQPDTLHLTLKRTSLTGKRVPPCFAQVSLLPGEDLSTVLTTTLSTLQHTWEQIQQDVPNLLLDLGYTSGERQTLSETLAETLYREGWPSCAREHLHRVMTQGELQTLLFHLICGGTLTRFFPPPQEEEGSASHASHLPPLPRRTRYRCGDHAQWRSRRRANPDPS